MPPPVSDAVRGAILDAVAPGRALAGRWNAHPVRCRLTEDFDRATTGEDAAGIAERWLADDRWVAELLAPLSAALADRPLLQPPLRASRDAARIGAILFDHPAVSISASIVDALALMPSPAGATIAASGRIGVTRYVRAAGATLRQWRADGSGMRMVAEPPRALHDGMVVRCDGRVAAQRLLSADRDVVQIVAHVRLGAAATMREYRIDDGMLIQSATLDDGAARSAMLLTLLRHLGRTDAGDRFDAASRDFASPFRWQAMREWVALDAAAALPRLAEIARDDPDPEHRAAAAATRALVEARMATACRA